MRFVSLSGVLRKARRYVSGGGSVQEEEVKDPAKLTEVIRQLQRRMSELEAVTPPEPVEFEVNVGFGGTVTTLHHNFNSAVRWYVVQWHQVGGTASPVAGPRLVQDVSSTSMVLALRSYTAGKAVVRVERAVADIDPGITVSSANMCPKFAALTTDQTNAAGGAYADLYSTTVTTVGASSSLLIQFGASFVKTGAGGGVYFIILVDGVQVNDGTYSTTALNSAGNCVLQASHAVTAGDHTVLVRWANSANSTVCRPATNANEFASMFIQEIP